MRLISSLAMIALLASGSAALAGTSSTGVNYKGTVTQLKAGNGIVLTPNPITTTGTISIDGSVVPQSGASNTFTGDQTIIGNLTVGQPAATAAAFALAETTSGNLTVEGDLTLGGSINGGLLIEETDSLPNIYGGHSFSGTIYDIVGVTIAGGENVAYDSFVTIGGGSANGAGTSDGTDVGQWGTVGGGYGNTTYGSYATIGGGVGNEAGKADGTGQYATVGGGAGNAATGMWATVPGGLSNGAQGKGSFAAGINARATHDGSFVWADSYTQDPLFDSGANQFLARTTGGATFYTCYDQLSHGFCSGATLPAGGGSWSSTSSRESKANFASVEGSDVLKKLDRIPIETWNYKGQDPSIRHMGPVAQDFQAAFGLGEDDKHISSVDADGVALAAVQALYRLMQEKDRRIEQQAAEIQALKAGMQTLRSEVRSGAAARGEDARVDRLASARPEARGRSTKP